MVSKSIIFMGTNDDDEAFEGAVQDEQMDEMHQEDNNADDIDDNVDNNEDTEEDPDEETEDGQRENISADANNEYVLDTIASYMGASKEWNQPLNTVSSIKVPNCLEIVDIIMLQ